MKKADRYRETLRTLQDWDEFLLQESGLPGPRGNLELAHVVAQEGDRALFERYLAFDAEQAPTNDPHEFLAFCGVLGLGRLLAQGQGELLEDLRLSASDPRWRIREAVAQALQYLGEADMGALLREMEAWSRGTALEQRAAAAGLCEPRLLGEAEQIKSVLQILDQITASIPKVEDRRSDEFQALRKGMGYCWSVAVAAYPQAGEAAMEKWFASDDKDVRWIMKQNLRKNGWNAWMPAGWQSGRRSWTWCLPEGLPATHRGRPVKGQDGPGLVVPGISPG